MFHQSIMDSSSSSTSCEMDLSMNSLKRSLDSLESSSSSSHQQDRPWKRARAQRKNLNMLKRKLERVVNISEDVTSIDNRKRGSTILNEGTLAASLRGMSLPMHIHSSTRAPKHLLHLGTDLLALIVSYAWDDISAIACVCSGFSTNRFARRVAIQVGLVDTNVHSELCRDILLSGIHLLHSGNLAEAARLDLIAVVQPLISISSVVQLEDAMWKAIACGRIQTVLRILASPRYNVHAHHEKALLVAVTFGRIDIVRTLIDRGADVTSAGPALLKAAVVATFQGKTEGPLLLQTLLEAGDEAWSSKVISETLRYCCLNAPAGNSRSSSSGNWGLRDMSSLLLNHRSNNAV